MHALATVAATFLALVQATFSLGPAHAQTPAQATVLFGGDMMFDRTVRSTIDEKGGDFIFSCIDGTLAGADLVVANLEGPITASSSTSAGSEVGAADNYVFTFPLSTARLLAAHGIGAVNLGNNHILNFGQSGVRSTITALDAAGVAHFGSPLTHEVAELTVGGIPMALINYDQFGSSGSSGRAAASTTVEQIELARMAGELPVVYTHWGIEYATTSPQYVRDLAHRFVDAGAAIVIGSHPHVVEGHETYGSTAFTTGKGVPIYYSLGNFIFDQYFSDAVDHGLLLQVAFTSRGVAGVKEIPIALGHDRRTCPVQ